MFGMCEIIETHTGLRLESLNERDLLKRQGLGGGGLILKWILQKCNWRVWRGLYMAQDGTSAKLL